MTAMLALGGVVAYLCIGVVTLGVTKTLSEDAYNEVGGGILFLWPLAWVGYVLVNLAFFLFRAGGTVGDWMIEYPKRRAAKSLPRATVIKDSK